MDRLVLSAGTLAGLALLLLLSSCTDELSRTLVGPMNDTDGNTAFAAVAISVQPLTVHILDVRAAGDAAVILNGTSKVIIDGGHSQANFGLLLDSLGLNNSTIDAVILTHPHTDHSFGLLELFRTKRQITIHHFFDNGDAVTSTSINQLRDSARARAGRGELVYRDSDDPCGDGSVLCTLQLDGGARLHVMRPNPAGTSIDNRSTPVKLVGPDSASFTMWFGGDGEQEEINWFLDEARYDLTPGMRITVLKGQQHGKCQSITARLLRVADPDLVTFSLLGSNSSGLIHTETKDLLARNEKPWYRTDRNGTITFVSPGVPGGGYSVHVAAGRASMDGESDALGGSRRCVWPTVPLAPSGLRAEVGAAGSIELWWQDHSTDERGFEVQRHAGSGNWAVIATLEAGSGSWRDSEVEVETTYHYRVRAFNDGGKSAWSDTSSARVPGGTANRPPSANAGGPYAGYESVGMLFDGSASSDPDGDAITYQWNFGDASNGTGIAPTHRYRDDGSYMVELIVTDANGVVGHPSFALVTVSNVAPSVSVTLPATAEAGGAVDLTGAFTDPGADDAPWSYAIAWGDGSSSSGSTSDPNGVIAGSHAFATAGTYTVRLTVTDKDGGTGSVTQAIVVEAAPAAPSFTLTVRGYKEKSLQKAELRWVESGASRIDIYRNDVRIVRGALDSGSYLDAINAKGGGTYRHRVCRSESTTECSNETTLIF
jgi:beta-lactamase superfamily II metal-dependent hydrolase/PKD repeat protein